MDSELLRRALDLRVLPTPPSVFPPRAAEAEELLPWLDDGLRGGRRGRLHAEYQAVLSEPTTEHVVLRSGEAPVSHALARLCTIEAGGRSLTAGMIGLVYTDPRHRRAGLAARCIAKARDRLRSRGAALTMLWSDRPGFYERLGFVPAGLERLIRVDVAACRRALRRSAGEIHVAPPGPRDWPELEALYEARPTRARREAGRLATLCAAPDCDVVLCRRGDTPVAYAALGRGDDFRGVVHDWAGDGDGVLACLCSLFEPEAEGLLLAGPDREPAVELLNELGAPVLERPFALVALEDAGAVLAAAAAGHAALEGASLRPEAAGYRLALPGRDVWLEPRQAMELLFGPELPRDALASLPAPLLRAIGERLPWPLFVWGFDSV